MTDFSNLTDADLFDLVVDSDAHSPTEQEFEAFQELVNRGYAPSFIARHVERVLNEKNG